MNKLKLIEKLNEIFNYQDNEVEMPKFPFMVINPSTICAVYGRTKEMKRLLLRFVYEDEIGNSNCRKVTDLEYEKSELGCAFTSEYLSKIFSIFNLIDENPYIYCKKDYPIKIQSESLGFILAPRVNE